MLTSLYAQCCPSVPVHHRQQTTTGHCIFFYRPPPRGLFFLRHCTPRPRWSNRHTKPSVYGRSKVEEIHDFVLSLLWKARQRKHAQSNENRRGMRVLTLIAPKLWTEKTMGRRGESMWPPVSQQKVRLSRANVSGVIVFAANKNINGVFTYRYDPLMIGANYFFLY